MQEADQLCARSTQGKSRLASGPHMSGTLPLTYRLPRQFMVFALCAGVTYGNATVGMPLQVVASGLHVSLAGLSLALLTLGTAAGALLTAPLRNRIGSASATLIPAAATSATGCLLLTTPTTTATLLIGATIAGAGGGMFWVCSQVMLSANPSSVTYGARFLLHFAIYTAGALLGSIVTGGFIMAVEKIGAGPAISAEASLCIGALTSIVALLVWWLNRLAIVDTAGTVTTDWRLLTRGMTRQLSDLFLVATLSIVALLAPLVLLGTFSFSSLAVGVTVGAIALSKILGTLIARHAAVAFGSRVTIFIFLIAGLLISPVLALTTAPPMFVIALMFEVMALAGVWPLVAAAAHALTERDLRGGAAVAWNIREYTVIALSGVAETWLYAVSSRFAMFAAATALLLVATMYAACTLYSQTAIREIP